MTKPTGEPKGRPTKLNDDVTKTICDSLRAGGYIETAAAMADVSKQTLYTWLRAGRKAAEAGDHNDPHAVFLDAVEKAMAQGEMRDLALIGQAAVTQWQAAAWRLERRYPQRWRRREALDVQHTEMEKGEAERGMDDIARELEALYMGAGEPDTTVEEDVT